MGSRAGIVGEEFVELGKGRTAMTCKHMRDLISEEQWEGRTAGRRIKVWRGLGGDA